MSCRNTESCPNTESYRNTPYRQSLTSTALWLFFWGSSVALAATSSDTTLPTPDLSGLDPAVAQQISATREALDDQLRQENPSAVEQSAAFGELGIIYHAYQLAEAAQACYEKAIQLDPSQPSWQHLLAYLHQQEGQLEDAVRHYRKSSEMAPAYIATWIRLAIAEIELGQLESAGDHLRHALKLDPGNVSALAEQGQIALSERRWSDAVAVFEGILEAIPQANRLHYPLALAYRGLGDATKAREHLARRGEVGVRPNDPLVDALAEKAVGERIYRLQGKRAYQAGRSNEAVIAFRKAVDAAPQSAASRVDLSTALVAQGYSEAAMEQLREAVRLDPDSATAHYNLAVLLAKSGALHEAVPLFQRTVLLNPKDVEAFSRLALALRLTQKPREAFDAFGKVLELDPSNEEAWLAQGGILVDVGRYAHAAQVLEQALEALPSSGLLAHSLARLLAGSPDPSVRNGTRAIELATVVLNAAPNLDHAETLAMALAEAGRCEDAANLEEQRVEAMAEAPPEVLAAAQQTLERYRKGGVCRAPLGVASNGYPSEAPPGS